MNLQKKMQEIGGALEKEIEEIGVYIRNNPFEANKDLIHYNSVMMALKFAVVNFDLVAQTIGKTKSMVAAVQSQPKSDTVN